MVVPILLINALKTEYPPERVVAVHIVFLPSDCSQNVTFLIVSAPACQKWYIFQLNFNNSYLRPISSILDRCARCMIPMVWRTCRFGAFKNDTFFKRISIIPLYRDMWPSKILFSPMVLATFWRLHYFYLIFTNHDRDKFCWCLKLYTYSKWISNVFILLLLHVMFAHF